MVSMLLARLANVPVEQISHEIDDSLRQLCGALNLKRASFWEVAAPSASARLTQIYQSTDEFPSSTTEISPGTFPWIVDRLRSGESVVIDRLEELPPEAEVDKASLRRFGAESVVFLPLTSDGVFRGVMPLHRFAEAERWLPETVESLQMIARVFSGAISRRQAAADLGAAEARLRLAEESAMAGFWEADPETEQVWASPTVKSFFGLSSVEPITLRSMLAAVHPDDRDRVLADMEGKIKGGDAFEIEYRVPTPDGGIRWLRARGRIHRPLPIGSPRVHGITFDVTEQRRTEDELRGALDEVSRLRDQLSQENVLLRHEVERGNRPFAVTGTSAALRHVLRQAERVAETGSTVLLLGETGTGKERFATLIHELSARRGRPMVRVNCAAIPATLIESELFGREKGAYTGAGSRQIGRFELAHGSTIFLDEIGDLPPEVQVKLLRVLQERQIERLGSPQPILIDVRIVAATHHNLHDLVQAGRFRQDLFYRLNVFPITIPPLRERREDIPPLVREIVAELEESMGKRFEYVSIASMDALVQYDWPGNVRELRNVLERAMILGSGPTLRVPVPQVPASPAAVPSGESIVDIERHHIISVLTKTGWRVRGEHGAAKVLGLKPTTLEHRMARLGIRRPGK